MSTSSQSRTRWSAVYKLPVPENEQCPVEKYSYKGYSPPKCTYNGTPHIQVKTCTFILKCLHVMDENVTHAIPYPESSSTSSHMHMPNVATREPGPTQLTDPNRNPGDARPKPLTKSVYQIHFILKSLRKRFQFRASP